MSYPQYKSVAQIQLATARIHATENVLEQSAATMTTQSLLSLLTEPAELEQRRPNPKPNRRRSEEAIQRRTDRRNEEILARRLQAEYGHPRVVLAQAADDAKRTSIPTQTMLASHAPEIVATLDAKTHERRRAKVPPSGASRASGAAHD